MTWFFFRGQSEGIQPKVILWRTGAAFHGVSIKPGVYYRGGTEINRSLACLVTPPAMVAFKI